MCAKAGVASLYEDCRNPTDVANREKTGHCNKVVWFFSSRQLSFGHMKDG